MIVTMDTFHFSVFTCIYFSVHPSFIEIIVYFSISPALTHTEVLCCPYDDCYGDRVRLFDSFWFSTVMDCLASIRCLYLLGHLYFISIYSYLLGSYQVFVFFRHLYFYRRLCFYWFIGLSLVYFSHSQIASPIVTIVQHSRDLVAPLYVQRLSRWLMLFSKCQCYPTGFCRFRFIPDDKYWQ